MSTSHGCEFQHHLGFPLVPANVGLWWKSVGRLLEDHGLWGRCGGLNSSTLSEGRGDVVRYERALPVTDSVSENIRGFFL